MPNVNVKVPSSVAAPGSVITLRDGSTATVSSTGVVTVSSLFVNDLIAAGCEVASSYQGAPTANITANASGGQTNATALGYGINQIATVGAANASVALPAAVPGKFVTVINDGANTAQVFGAGSDTINGVAAATGVAQMQSSEVTYWCAVAGQWRCSPGFGFAGGLETNIAANGIASNGTTQVGATALGAMINRITTVGATNGAVVLPASQPGMQLTVTNANGANAANVYPAVNETINALSANGGFNLATGKTVQFSCAVAGQWHGVLSA